MPWFDTCWPQASNPGYLMHNRFVNRADQYKCERLTSKTAPVPRGEKCVWSAWGVYKQLLRFRRCPAHPALWDDGIPASTNLVNQPSLRPDPQTSSLPSST